MKPKFTQLRRRHGNRNILMKHLNPKKQNSYEKTLSELKFILSAISNKACSKQRETLSFIFLAYRIMKLKI